MTIRVTIPRVGDGHLVGVTTHPSDPPRLLTQYMTRAEFEAGVRVLALDLQLGPRGDFRSARFSVEYVGQSISGRTFSRGVCRDLLEPLARRDGITVTKTRASRGWSGWTKSSFTHGD